MEAQQDEEAQLAVALSELEAKASRHITDLFASTLDDRAAFNAQLTQIREDLAALRAATRDLAILAEEQDTEEESGRLADVLKGHQAEYERLQTAFKQANIQARRNTEAAAAAARKAMLAGGQAGEAPARAAGQAETVATSQGITKSLLRTRQLMAQELEHTSATLAAMDASNERLAEGREELRGHRSLFSGSRRLLRALFRSSVLDSVSLYGGLALFFIVVAYILQKRTLYFAPVGKFVAPVAGTAWNVSRSAAQQAGQLPRAVLALHRRLTAKGGGAALPVDDELPASVDRLLQGDANDDRQLEQKWRQRVELSADEQQEADASGTPASEVPMGDAAQQWTEAEPDPLADIDVVPDGGATAPEELVVNGTGSEAAAEAPPDPDSAPAASQDAPKAAAEPATEPVIGAETSEQTSTEPAAGGSKPPGYTAFSGAEEAAGQQAPQPRGQAAEPAAAVPAVEPQEGADAATNAGAAHPAEPPLAANVTDGAVLATDATAGGAADQPDEPHAAGGTMAADEPLPASPVPAGLEDVGQPQQQPDAAVPTATGGMSTDEPGADVPHNVAEPAAQPGAELPQPAAETPEAAAADDIPADVPAAEHAAASLPHRAAAGGSTDGAESDANAPTHQPAAPTMSAPTPEGEAAPMLQPEPAASGMKPVLESPDPPKAAPSADEPQATATEVEAEGSERVASAAEAGPDVELSAEQHAAPAAEQPTEDGGRSSQPEPLLDAADDTQEATAEPLEPTVGTPSEQDVEPAAEQAAQDSGEPLESSSRHDAADGRREATDSLFDPQQPTPEAMDHAQPAVTTDQGSQPSAATQGATAPLLKPQQPAPEAADNATPAVQGDSKQLDEAADNAAAADEAEAVPPLQPSKPEPEPEAAADGGAQQQPVQAGTDAADLQPGQAQQQVPGAEPAAEIEPATAPQPEGGGASEQLAAGPALASQQGMQPFEDEDSDGATAAEAPKQQQRQPQPQPQPSGAAMHNPAAATDGGAHQPGQAAEAEDNVIYDEQGNKFEWRWHAEAGAAGKWKLYAAGTDTMVHEADEEALGVAGAAQPSQAADAAQPSAAEAEVPGDRPIVPAAEGVHDEL